MAEKGYDVLFSNSSEELDREALVLLVPSERSWNDFGYNFNASMSVRNRAGATEKVSCYVIPIRDDCTIVGRFEQWVLESWNLRKRPFPAKKSSFFVVLSSQPEYQKLR